MHKRLKRLLSFLNLKRLIERKDEAKRDQNIRDLSNPYNIPSLQLIHDVIITEKIGSEAMVRYEGKRSKSYGNATDEKPTDNEKEQSIDNDIVEAKEEDGIKSRDKEKSGNLIDVTTDIDETYNTSEVPEIMDTEKSGNLIDVTGIDDTYNILQVPE